MPQCWPLNCHQLESVVAKSPYLLAAILHTSLPVTCPLCLQALHDTPHQPSPGQHDHPLGAMSFGPDLSRCTQGPPPGYHSSWPHVTLSSTGSLFHCSDPSTALLCFSHPQQNSLLKAVPVGPGQPGYIHPRGTLNLQSLPQPYLHQHLIE